MHKLPSQKIRAFLTQDCSLVREKLNLAENAQLYHGVAAFPWK
jgi:hypothetical protein